MCGPLGHTEECILLICVIEEMFIECSPCVGFAGGVRPGARKAEFGELKKKTMWLLKNKHLKNDKGNKGILDQLIELEIVRAG